jgi:hypothetical protein
MALKGVSEMPRPRPTPEAPDRGRFSARRKTDAILRPLRGEDLEPLSREYGVAAATSADCPS